MRWMIGMLLVANLVVFLWWNTGQERVFAPASVSKPDVGTLQLISELPAESAGETPPVAHVNESTPTPRQAAPERESSLAAAKYPAGSAFPSATRPSPQRRSPVVTETPAREPPQQPVARSTEEAVAPVTLPTAKVELTCWELGPFEDEARLQALSLPDEVERLGVARSPIQVPAGFYVLIPAQNDRRSARAVVERLKEKGVRDFWLFNTGPLKNAISLGMFNRERNAQQRRDEIAQLGFFAEVHARHRTVEGIVLQLKGPKSAEIEGQLRGVSAGQMRPTACPPAESP